MLRFVQATLLLEDADTSSKLISFLFCLDDIDFLYIGRFDEYLLIIKEIKII